MPLRVSWGCGCPRGAPGGVSGQWWPQRCPWGCLGAVVASEVPLGVSRGSGGLRGALGGVSGQWWPQRCPWGCLGAVVASEGCPWGCPGAVEAQEVSMGVPIDSRGPRSVHWVFMGPWGLRSVHGVAMGLGGPETPLGVTWGRGGHSKTSFTISPIIMQTGKGLQCHYTILAEGRS